ncbi:MAG: conserved repeat protein, partial [Pedosphaera sp.]|nr:conserved repeat protein [Pedosphaera sp.]
MSLIWRVLYRLYRVFSSSWYWLPRRFAPAGLAVLGGLIVAAIVGTDTENTVAYQGFALLLFLLLVAIGFSWRFRLRFSATRWLPRFGTVGQPLSYRISVKNLTGQTQAGLTLLENLADTRPSFTEWRAAQLADQKHSRSFQVSQRRRTNPFKVATLKNAAVPPLPPNQEIDVRIELTPLRRGVLRFTEITLARPDPFGLFRSFSKVPAVQTALILPRRYPLAAIALPGSLKYQEGGVAMASNVGQSEEFVALREYRSGDPMRHIHWRSWARVGKPIVKEFEDEFFVRHALVLDTFSDQPHSEVFEEAVSVAASFACTIRTQESLLDLLFVGSQAFCFTSGRGLAHADQMLEILASVRGCPDQPFRSLDHLVLDHLASVSGCICVLLAWDEERREFVKKIKTLGMPVLVFVIVPSGQGKTLEPGPMRDDPERFHVLE